MSIERVTLFVSVAINLVTLSFKELVNRLL